jgi:hypothetical protein
MASTFESAGAAAAASPANAAVLRPWGVWASLVCYLVVFEGMSRASDALIAVTGFQTVIDHNVIVARLVPLVYWSLNLLIIVAAVRLTGISLADYLAWKRPKARHIALAVALVAVYYVAFTSLLIAIGEAAPSVEAYRAEIAGGASPVWYVLKYWPAILLAPFVEESFFRGFFWYGVTFRLGRWPAYILTSLLFAAMHYNYWMPNGHFYPAILVIHYLIPSLIFGAVRWRSGSTVASVVAHGLDNAALRMLPMVLAGLSP